MMIKSMVKEVTTMNMDNLKEKREKELKDLPSQVKMVEDGTKE